MGFTPPSRSHEHAQNYTTVPRQHLIEVVHMMSNDVIKMQKLINYTYIVL